MRGQLRNITKRPTSASGEAGPRMEQRCILDIDEEDEV